MIHMPVIDTPAYRRYVAARDAHQALLERAAFGEPIAGATLSISAHNLLAESQPYRAEQRAYFASATAKVEPS